LSEAGPPIDYSLNSHILIAGHNPLVENVFGTACNGSGNHFSAAAGYPATNPPVAGQRTIDHMRHNPDKSPTPDTRSEIGTIRKSWHSRVSIALVYPNRYHVGMSNLGFQTLYRLFNSRLPRPTSLPFPCPLKTTTPIYLPYWTKPAFRCEPTHEVKATH